MEQFLKVRRFFNTDLDMYQCGSQICSSGHDYGPAIRDHFLIHFIISGKGIFQSKNQTYTLTKNQGFLICPDEITYYKADLDEPWHYIWFGFNGVKAEVYLKQTNLNSDNPIFTYEKDNAIKDWLDEMIASKIFGSGREIRLLGCLYMVLAQLIEVNGKELYLDNPQDRAESYVNKAVKYIENNYSRKLGILEISHYIGLDRSYLGVLFKKYLGISPQEYLIKLRINKACELMNNLNLCIGDISRSVGYTDTFLFSKMFKKVKGLAPRDYREKLKNNKIQKNNPCII